MRLWLPAFWLVLEFYLVLNVGRLQGTSLSGPVVKTMHFQCRGHDFDPGGNRSLMLHGKRVKKKKKKEDTCPTLTLSFDVAWGERKGPSGSCGALGNFFLTADLQIVYLFNLLNDVSRRGWWGPSRTVAVPLSAVATIVGAPEICFHSLPCGLSPGWTCHPQERPFPAYTDLESKKLFKYSQWQIPHAFPCEQALVLFWWLLKLPCNYFEEDPLVLSDYGSYWPHMAVECLKCG